MATPNDYDLRLKALDVGLWDYDLDTDALACDARWHDMLKLERGSVSRIADFRPHIHPDDVDLATAVDLDQVAEMIALDHRYHIDFRVIRSDGEIRWWRSVACLLVDDQSGHRRAVGCVTDVTEFRQLAHPIPHRTDELPNQAEALSDETSATLSARELECLRWVSVGKTAWETATIMGRSQRTVEFHLLNAVRKLSARNKIHAAIIAVRKGLV